MVQTLQSLNPCYGGKPPEIIVLLTRWGVWEPSEYAGFRNRKPEMQRSVIVLVVSLMF